LVSSLLFLFCQPHPDSQFNQIPGHPGEIRGISYVQLKDLTKRVEHCTFNVVDPKSGENEGFNMRTYLGCAIMEPGVRCAPGVIALFIPCFLGSELDAMKNAADAHEVERVRAEVAAGQLDDEKGDAGAPADPEEAEKKYKWVGIPCAYKVRLKELPGGEVRFFMSLAPSVFIVHCSSMFYPARRRRSLTRKRKQTGALLFVAPLPTLTPYLGGCRRS
jgi:hypothetical protein